MQESKNNRHQNNSKDQENEVQLWENFIKGNKEAFSKLYQKYYYILYNYGFYLINNEELVKDSMQEMFFNLWKNKDKLPIPTSIKGYLFKAFKNKLLDTAKKDSKFTYEEDVSLKYDTQRDESYESRLISELTSEENQYRLEQAINQLTKRQKEAVFLRFFENLSYPEIAKILSIGIDAVYVLISRAVDVLRKHFAKVVLLISIILGFIFN